jgi:transposase
LYQSTAQQDLQLLHRIRERLIVQRTSLINHARGLLADWAPLAIENAAPSNLGRELFLELVDQLTDVNGWVAGNFMAHLLWVFSTGENAIHPI